MKKLTLLILLPLAAASLAYGGDVLGAHNGYGRGCVMCHAPHGGAAGNGVSTSDTSNGSAALWGGNLTPYYSQTFIFNGFAVTLPPNPSAGAEDPTVIVLLCLSCHDGVLSRVSMMKGRTVETLPVVGGNAPTLFGLTPGDTKNNNYINDHPVGPAAILFCGAPDWWDCTGGGFSNQISMNGRASKQFLINYPASFWNGPYPLASFSTTVNGLTCTTCHDQHSMTVWSVGGKNYTTMFFVKGQYNPSTGGNSVAQFCRNCHGGNSNEMAGLMSIPTT